jgi:plastocyanin
MLRGMRRSLAALPLAVVLAAAGCGGSSSTSDSGSGSGSASSVGGGTTVSMKDIQFDPKTLSVKVGQKVTWKNDEPVEHNAVATKGASFKSPVFGEGKTYSYTTKKAGTIEYECTLHPGMTGTLTVK